jgi:hypothetical protein
VGLQKLPNRYSKRTILGRSLPLEIQYVIRQHRDGYEVLTAVQALVTRAETLFRPAPENPIHVARLYLAEHEGKPPKSYAAIAGKFNVSRAEVCYHIALVKRLPGDFVEWLEQCEDHNALRMFTERRLRPIAKLEDSEEQWRFIKRLKYCCGNNGGRMS